MAEQERPPLWRVMQTAFWSTSSNFPGDRLACEICAVRQWLIDAGLVSTAGTKSTPGSDARLLEALEIEAKRAEAGE